MDFLNLTPLNPPTKTQFLAHFVAEGGSFGRFGGCVAPRTPLATGLPNRISNLSDVSSIVFSENVLISPSLRAVLISNVITYSRLPFIWTFKRVFSGGSSDFFPLKFFLLTIWKVSIDILLSSVDANFKKNVNTTLCIKIKFVGEMITKYHILRSR